MSGYVAILPYMESKSATDLMELADKPPMEQIAAIERGLPSGALNQIARRLGLPKRRIINSLRFAQRTITAREKAKGRFTTDESERLLRVLRVRRIVRDVFTSDEAVAEWLNAPDRSLGLRTPLEMLATGLGAAKVENLARAMVHGVPL